MKRFTCGLVVLGCVLVLTGVLTGQASAQQTYVYTTIDPPDSVVTTAVGINNSGQISGSYEAGSFLGPYRGFLYSSGRYTTLAVPGSEYTYADHINNVGQVVGYSGGSASPTSGFLLSGGRYTSFTVPGAFYTYALGINDNQQIVGAYSTSPIGFSNYAFLYSAGKFTTLVLPTVPGAPAAGAVGINNAGQIVGTYTGLSGTSVATHGFLLNGGSLTTLDVPGMFETHADGINNAGEIVGWFLEDGIPHGFLYKEGSYTTFDVPGSFGGEFLGINDLGQIVGIYEDAHGDHGFLATPVPEPSTVLLLGLGTLGWVRLMWRRKQAFPSSRGGFSHETNSLGLGGSGLAVSWGRASNCRLPLLGRLWRP